MLEPSAESGPALPGHPEVPSHSTGCGAVLLANNVAPPLQALEDSVKLVLRDVPQGAELALQAAVQVVAVAGSLEQQARRLTQLVARFRLDAEAVS